MLGKRLQFDSEGEDEVCHPALRTVGGLDAGQQMLGLSKETKVLFEVSPYLPKELADRFVCAVSADHWGGSACSFKDIAGLQKWIQQESPGVSSQAHAWAQLSLRSVT